MPRSPFRTPHSPLHTQSVPLARSFYDRDVLLVARGLLGKVLVREHGQGITAGRIVESEAYLSRDDPACHASRGMTPRNTVMFGPPGHAYVYSIHSRYCLNVVTDPEGMASAVLIRAVEPLEGIELMQRRRGARVLRELALRDLARGPARLCEAFDIDRALNGWDLTRGDELWIAEGDPVPEQQTAITPRVGVTSAHDLPLRFVVSGNTFVSSRRVAPRDENSHG